MWIVMAGLSAFFASLTSILGKCGIKNTDSDFAMGIRTLIILIFSFLMVIVSGSINSIRFIDSKSLVFLILSGVSTGISWIFYFKALGIGEVKKVVVIDKTSIVLSIIFAMVFLNETNNLAIKIGGILFILIGTILMLEVKGLRDGVNNNLSLIYAFISVIFAALTSILARVGIDNVNSYVGVFIRTIVVFLLSLVIILLKGKSIVKTSKKELMFITLSGLSTGLSWFCYYYAIKYGVVSAVIPIDKLSIVLTVIFCRVFFKEILSKKFLLGLLFMVIGTFLMTLFS